MHSAIVVVKPPDNYGETQRWQKLTADAFAKTQDNPALEELGQNVWIIDFHKAPGVLAQLIAACERFDFAYRLLQFEGEPEWIRWNPNPRQS